MTESLKNADRIHAISFGKFFLQAFGDNVDAKEVKEVFQHWNISNSTSFSGLDADKFDERGSSLVVFFFPGNPIAITVGRPVARPPPYRSPRAELPHGAPQSYSLRT